MTKASEVLVAALQERIRRAGRRLEANGWRTFGWTLATALGGMLLAGWPFSGPFLKPLAWTLFLLCSDLLRWPLSARFALDYLSALILLIFPSRADCCSG